MAEVPKGVDVFMRDLMLSYYDMRKFITHFLKVIGIQMLHLSLFTINITVDQV